MTTDTLYLNCPGCEESFKVTTYKGPNTDQIFHLDNAPLSILTEVNEESKAGRIECIHCGMAIALVVRFIAYCKPLSTQQILEWREE